MKKHISTLVLILLAACQTPHRLEKDTRYIKLATVTDKYEFSDIERQQAEAIAPPDSDTDDDLANNVGPTGYGGIMLGLGDHHVIKESPPQINKGANRYTVQPLNSEARIEVMSYWQYKVGDCVKVLAGHPSAYPRFFVLKPDERCKTASIK